MSNSTKPTVYLSSNYLHSVRAMKDWYRRPHDRVILATTALRIQSYVRALSRENWSLLQRIELRIVEGRVRRGIPPGTPLGRGTPPNVG